MFLSFEGIFLYKGEIIIIKEVIAVKAKSLMIGFVTGTIISGAAVLLSAPVSGKETRTRLKKSSDEIAASAKELKLRLTEIKSEAVNASKVSKDTIKSFVSDVKILLEDWKQDIEPNKEELTRNIKEIESSIQELESIAGSEDKEEKS